MAVITATSLQGTGSRTATVTTLGASDTLVFSASKHPLLVIENNTAASITANIDGSDSTTIAVEGYGTLDVSAGYDVSVADGAIAVVPLRSISAYLRGTVTVTGADGATAYILES